MASNVDIINTALSLEGKLSYKFGGNNIADGEGDCSDFTEYVYAVHGFDIGADTAAQYWQGYSVSRDAIKPGDLVFFKNTYESGKVDGVSHVGIALGNDKFINLNGDGCVVSDLTDIYWKEHYLDARRISGIAYQDYTYDGVTSNPATTTETPDLVWWGDIVRVVVIVIIIAAGLTLLGFGVGKEITKGVA